MAGRRSVWSDPRLIERARSFVPATDEVWRLQRGLGPESRAFQRMADRGHYRGKGGSRQGIYVCTPDGELLASINSLSADRVLATMEEGLAAWNALDEDARRAGLERAPDDLDQEPRWEWSYPVGGLVLRSVNRDLPPDGLPGSPPPSERANLDHAWFSAKEARGFLPDVLEVGRTFDVDPLLTTRLARFHLVDNVRGQTLPFAPGEVQGSRITGTVVRASGDEVELRFQGSTVAEADGVWRLGENDWTPTREWPRSLSTRILGRAVWDLRRQEFSSFELVSVGRRHGVTGLNRPPEDVAGPIGFLFEEAGDTPAEHIAPAFVDVYDAPWIQALD